MSFGYLTALAVDERFVYVGSEEGVISVYERNDVEDYVRNEDGVRVGIGNGEVGTDRNGEEMGREEGLDKSKNEEVDGNENISENKSKRAGELIPHTYIIHHTKNVTSLVSDNSLLISGSWDNDMVVTDINTHSKVYSYTHPSGVWCVRKEGTRIYTACMDGCIRMFEDGELKECVSVHGGCVRTLIVYGERMVGVSNDGRVLLCGIDDKTVVASRMLGVYCYDVLVLGNGLYTFLFLADDGVVFITDHCLGRIRKACIGEFCWCVVRKHEHLYFGSSKGNVIRIGVDDLIEHSTDVMMIEKGVVVNAQNDENISKQLEEIKSKIKDSKDYKIEGTMLFQRQGDTWIQVGEVMGKRDNTFTVELDNKKLELSFDNDENVYDVADRFLRENKLGDGHRDEIVEFIRQNFKKCGMKKFKDIDTVGLRKYIEDEDLVKVLESIKEHGVKYNGNNTIDGNQKGVAEECTVVNDEPDASPAGAPINGSIDCIPNMQMCVLESKLKALFTDQNDNFYIIDIYRFLSLYGLPIDYSFILTYAPKTRKEKVTFVMLVSNLYFCPPFDLEMVHGKIREMVGAVSDNVWNVYEENRRSSSA